MFVVKHCRAVTSATELEAADHSVDVRAEKKLEGSNWRWSQYSIAAPSFWPNTVYYSHLGPTAWLDLD